MLNKIAEIVQNGVSEVGVFVESQMPNSKKNSKQQAPNGRARIRGNTISNDNNNNNKNNSDGFDDTNNGASKVISYKYNDKLYPLSIHSEMILQDLIDYVRVYHQVPQSHLYVEYNGKVLEKLDTSIFLTLQNYQFSDGNNTKSTQYLNVVNASDTANTGRRFITSKKNASTKEKNLINELHGRLRLKNNRLNKLNTLSDDIDGAIENNDRKKEQRTQMAVKIAQEFSDAYYGTLIAKRNLRNSKNVEEKNEEKNEEKEKTNSADDVKWDHELHDGIAAMVETQTDDDFGKILVDFADDMEREFDHWERLDNIIGTMYDSNHQSDEKSNDYETQLQCLLLIDPIRKELNDQAQRDHDHDNTKQNKKSKDSQEKQNVDLDEEFERLNKINNVPLLSEWYKEYQTKRVERIKKKSLEKMINKKMQTLESQLVFAKNLLSSPFFDDLAANAHKMDKEITQLAKLAKKTLVIDAIDRTVDVKKSSSSSSKKVEHLNFEMRLDKDFDSVTDKDRNEFRLKLANLLNISVNDVEFVACRAGSYIEEIRVPIEILLKEIVTEPDNWNKGIDKVGAKIKSLLKKTGAEPDSLIDELDKAREKLRSLSMGTVTESDSWNKEVDKAYKYVKDILDDNMNDEKFYESTQCVAMVIRKCSSDDTSKIELRNKILEHGSDVSSSSSDKDNKDKKKDDSWKDKFDTNIMNPRWDKVYTKTGNVVWDGPNTDGLDRGDEPYFCPTGWKRYGIKIDNFDKKYTGWPVCYHGSQTHIIGSILSHGILGSQAGDENKKFFSPSIEYCAHPRYATPKKLSDGKGYIQTILQCRINPKKMKKQTETMGIHGTKQIDKNFSVDDQQKSMEWYLQLNKRDKLTDNYVVYGIMTRVCDDPSKLPESHWWDQHTINGGCGNKRNMNWRTDHLAM